MGRFRSGVASDNDHPPFPTAQNHQALARWIQSHRRQWAVTRLLLRGENNNNANSAGALTMDEARRMASNFAKLPELLARGYASGRRPSRVTFLVGEFLLIPFRARGPKCQL